MKLKKMIASLVIVAVLSTITVAGTLAYFTDEVTTRNVITTGNIDIVLNEKTADGLDFPKEGISGVMPGTDVSKIVTITNTGSGTAWIRVQVNTSIQSATGEPLPLKLADGSNAVLINAPSEGWLVYPDPGKNENVKPEDVYYYYTTALKPGQTTKSLFDTVTFAPEMGNEYQDCKVLVDVSAQAVQVANNIPADLKVTSIAGWPEA